MKKLYKMKALIDFYNPKTQKEIKKDEILWVDGTQKKILEELKWAKVVKDEEGNKRYIL